MPKHPDFKKIYARFTKQYGAKKGEDLYYAWLNKKGLDDTKPYPKGKEKKEKVCIVHGFEIKEIEGEIHLEGLIATSHIDSLDEMEDIEIPDVISKETLESFASQINSNKESRVMGVHHSEGKSGIVYGEADVINYPARIVELIDGEFGLFVDTKLNSTDDSKIILEQFNNGDLNSFSITYDTQGFSTTDFEWVGDKLVRVIGPDTKLYGYTAASDPVNKKAVATGYGYKEFKEVMPKENKEVNAQNKIVDNKSEETKMAEEEEKKKAEEEAAKKKAEEKADAEAKAKSDAEAKEKKELKEKEKMILEEKEKKTVEELQKKLEEMEVKEKVLREKAEKLEGKDVPLEVKEFKEILEGKSIEIKEQFKRAGRLASKYGLLDKDTSRAESREFKNFSTNGQNLEYKGLGITTNQNTDTDYLQSSAELQDVYDPVIYNALNQATLTWNVLEKDDYSGKGNNQVQFTLKTAANTSAGFYIGNAVTTGNVTRLKFQTKFKKLQVGVSVDGDMIAAARGGPIGDVFAQEVLDATMDMLAVLNTALYADVGEETESAVIGFEHITNSATNTTLYSLTRSTTNKLSPAAAGDTYINQASTIISMTNLRAASKQGLNEGAKKAKLVWFTNPTQGNMLRGKFDDSRRLLQPTDTKFGFSTDLFVDGIPVFEDKDCNTDDWWLVDLETHRVAIWVPPTIEKLGKSADAEEAFIKMYLATYNRAPRRMVQIYGCATS